MTATFAAAALEMALQRGREGHLALLAMEQQAVRAAGLVEVEQLAAMRPRRL